MAPSFEARKVKLRGYSSTKFKGTGQVMTSWVVEEAPRKHQAFYNGGSSTVMVPMPWLYYGIQLLSPSTKGYKSNGSLKLVAVGGGPKQLDKIDGLISALPLPNLSSYSPCHRAIELDDKAYDKLDLSKKKLIPTLKQLSTDAIVNWWGQSFNADLEYEEQPLFKEICQAAGLAPEKNSYQPSCSCCRDYYDEENYYNTEYDEFLEALGSLEVKDILKMKWPTNIDITKIIATPDARKQLIATAKDPDLLKW